VWGTPGTDELLIDAYRLNGVLYEVHLFFFPKSGLGRVTMTSDDVRDAFQKALSELTGRYGKPGLQSLNMSSWLAPARQDMTATGK